MNKIFNNKNHLYLLLTAVLFGFTMLLNATNKIVGCALVFVLITITANFISELYGKRKTMQSLVLCSVSSIGLLWNSNYYINDVKINILFASFAAVMISVYCGISMLGKLKSTYNFHIRSFISLIVASVIDSSVMGVALLNKFSITKVYSIFVSDIVVKFSYSVTACLVIFTCAYLLQQKNTARG